MDATLPLPRMIRLAEDEQVPYPVFEWNEARAACAILGHESRGMFLTAHPIHVCGHCWMRYYEHDDFGWIE